MDLIMAAGGLQSVPQTTVQYVYLDFDGELTQYNGEILTVANVEVRHSELTADRIAAVVSELNGRYAEQHVVFVTTRPAGTEYSTVFVGKTEAFSSCGSFAGLAETIDLGNQNKSDKAFVMLDSSNTDTDIVSAISHETDHLLGTLDHGGENLAAYGMNLRYDISSGVASDGIKLNYDEMYVSDGGAVKNTTLSKGGILFVLDGGKADSTVVQGGRMYVSSGGLAGNTVVNSAGLIYIGGSADTVSVNSGGSVFISSGGAVNSTSLNWGADMYVSEGAVANSTSLEMGCRMYISSGGAAANSLINFGGYVHISNGGIADNTCLNSGWLYVSQCGVAKNTSVKEGFVYILDGGAASDTIITGGIFTIRSGGIHRGTLQIGKDTSVDVERGGIVDFTVAGRTVEDDYLINDLSLIKWYPAYTITVDADQSEGTYKLAQGANSLGGSISIGDGTAVYGSMTVNGDDFVHNNKVFSLDQVGGNLTLTVVDQEPDPVLSGDAAGVFWSDVPGSSFIVAYSVNDFANVLQFKTAGRAIDTYQMPGGTYQWQVCSDQDTCFQGTDFTADSPEMPAKVLSDADGDMDVFFANAAGSWETGYAAQNLGTLNGWSGTGEQVLLDGKNKMTDVFIGSSDANVLVLTDDSCGDALFADDIFSALGDEVRLSQIDEIRAGAGDDIIDLTSKRYALAGTGLTVYGGSGNDTIWANSGDNILFGDAGNDRLVGAGGNDMLIGGSGDDSMHGGGGEDIFFFGANWGNDTVTQLAGGKVTLWFENAFDSSNWNETTFTFSDGVNSVKVSGVTEVSLKFGEKPAVAGAFLDAASEKIFEDKTKGMIA